ncbi:MAG TPA: zinc ribbon domain-containing protein [Gemmatimonadales bacterium]|nr:zinc ribbon domain-containing protein [Gemmatimonadales bacterium]
MNREDAKSAKNVARAGYRVDLIVGGCGIFALFASSRLCGATPEAHLRLEPFRAKLHGCFELAFFAETMPTYEYVCPAGHEFEKLQKITGRPRAKCPTCGRPATRKISGGAGLVFRGSGFYITDYGKDGKGPRKTEAPEAPAKAEPKAEARAESAPTAEPKAEKPAPKKKAAE